MKGLGELCLTQRKNYILWFLCGFNQQQMCSTAVFTILKNPHKDGPMQFQPMLFKGQLYIENLPSLPFPALSVEVLQ